MNTGKRTSGSITETDVKKFIRRRARGLHKGDCGRVLILAGGAGMTGAAVFAAKGALKSGSGLVYAVLPPEDEFVMKIAVPEVICVRWDAARGVLAGEEGISGRRGESYDAVCFGPGMGTGDESALILKTLLLNYDGPVVLDADGLNLAASDPEIADAVRNYPGDLVITPHEGEAERLLHAASERHDELLLQEEEWDEDPKTDPVPETREERVLRLASDYRCIAVLKGSGTLVADSPKRDPERIVRRNTTGNAGMATAGSGDVLTGIITGLAGQGIPLPDAARIGVFLHGRAGDLAAEEKGERGLTATDIAEAVPVAIRPFETAGASRSRTPGTKKTEPARKAADRPERKRQGETARTGSMRRQQEGR